MKKFLEKYQIYFNIYFFISIFALCLTLYFLYKKVNDISQLITSSNTQNSESANIPNSFLSPTDYCGTDCKNQIAQSVSAAVSTLSGSTKTIIQNPAVTVPSSSKTTYIPLGGPITTTSLSWVDAAGTDVYLDLATDYGKNAKISWEANMSVVSGQINARLYDVTHNITVEGSEISVADKNSLTNVGSANFSIWSGRNLYRVQIKSLNSSVVTFGNGRIKIVY